MAHPGYGALPRALKRCIHAVALATLLSGIAWLALHYAPTGWIDEAISRQGQAWALKLHGAAAMLALVVLGTLLSAHVLPRLDTPRNRNAGLGLLSGTTILAISGWGLYYLGDEALRGWASDFHIASGVAATVAFVHHIRFHVGSKTRASRRATASQPIIPRS